MYIVGWRVISTREAKPPVRCRCPLCGTDDARLVGKLRRRWFTMFFIPVAPLESADEAHRHTQCLECKQLFDQPIEQFARRAGIAGQTDLSQTFPVYNDLREQPDNGELMLRLLSMYRDLNELPEAEAAARHFPLALAANPKCQVILNQMRLRGGSTD